MKPMVINGHKVPCAVCGMPRARVSFFDVCVCRKCTIPFMAGYISGFTGTRFDRYIGRELPPSSRCEMCNDRAVKRDVSGLRFCPRCAHAYIAGHSTAVIGRIVTDVALSVDHLLRKKEADE